MDTLLARDRLILRSHFLLTEWVAGWVQSVTQQRVAAGGLALLAVLAAADDGQLA